MATTVYEWEICSSDPENQVKIFAKKVLNLQISFMFAFKVCFFSLDV